MEPPRLAAPLPAVGFAAVRQMAVADELLELSHSAWTKAEVSLHVLAMIDRGVWLIGIS
jgi:hypothetical protein